MSDSNDSSQKKISPNASPAKERMSAKSRIIVGACTVVTLASVGTAAFLFLKQDKPEKRNVVVTRDTVSSIVEEMNNTPKTKPGRYSVKMNTEWEFENGSSASSNAYVENSTSNTNAVYFDVVRSDTGETIYESPILPVGEHLTADDVKLNTKLSAGTYTCVLTYFMLENNEPYSPTGGKLNLELSITVKS